MSQKLTIYSDGGSRGNPGPAAIAYIVLNEQGETLKADTRYIGIRTNNQAEYEALIKALTFAAENKAQELHCYLDSELVVKQLNNQYAVKNPELRQLLQKISSIKNCFKKITFTNVPREHPEIQRADSLVNQTLNSQRGRNTQLKENNGISMFVHTSIRTSNMERSIDFYSRFFGLKLISRREIKQTNAEIAFLQDPEGKGGKLELTLYRSQVKFTQPDYGERLFDHLGFEVNDIAKTVAALRKENITITDEPFALNEYTTIAFVEDPDGTLIELIEHK